MSEAQTKLTVDFLFLDRETCGRCGGTEAAVDAAVTAVEPALAALGVMLDLRTTHVTTLDQARSLGFGSSPTVRVNDRDVQADVHESACGDCTQIGASGASVDCRHWMWRGERYDSAPVGLLVEALLRAALDSGQAITAPGPLAAATEANLARFFGADGRSCCGPAPVEASGCGYS